jgi:hypothetical protein
MNMILRGGQAAGVLGLALMALAVLSRLAGRYIIGGFESGSLLIAGIGAIVAGCFALLWVIAERGRS